MAEPFDLAGLKAKAEKATEGPWTNGMRGDGSSGDAHMCRVLARRAATPGHWAHGEQVAVTWHPDVIVSYVGLSRQQCVDNAEHIAASSPDAVLVLHAALVRYRQELVKARDSGAVALVEDGSAYAEAIRDANAAALDAFDQAVRL